MQCQGVFQVYLLFNFNQICQQQKWIVCTWGLFFALFCFVLREGCFWQKSFQLFHFDSLAQYCYISSAKAVEIPQSCTKLPIKCRSFQKWSIRSAFMRMCNFELSSQYFYLAGMSCNGGKVMITFYKIISLDLNIWSLFTFKDGMTINCTEILCQRLNARLQ